MPDAAIHASGYRWRLVAALASVYVIWGSTYLAIRFAVETLPPFLMAGIRFILSGGVLYAWARLRGAGKPDWLHWRSATIIGTLLLLGGNGGVVWAEQFVPSGLTALLITSEPLWVVLLVWLMPGGHRPTGGVVLGMISVCLELFCSSARGNCSTATAFTLAAPLCFSWLHFRGQSARSIPAKLGFPIQPFCPQECKCWPAESYSLSSAL